MLVMLTKEMSGARQANPKRMVIVTDEYEAEPLQLASRAISRPCVIY